MKRDTKSMTATPTSRPEALDRHLSANSTTASLADYLDRGAKLVTPEAVAALHRQQNSLRTKIASLAESERLRSRVALLASFFEEACAEAQADNRVHREIAFALLYFLKGADRIPDSVPEVGLLDDAMLVQLVLQHHAAALRAHCLRRGLACPAEIE